MDLVDKGAGPEVVNAINQAIQGQAVQSYLGETVTTTQIRVALDASANQQLLGCESENCMTSLGKTVEASEILGGSVAKVGDDFIITVLAVNPRDGSRLAMQQRKVPANRALYYYAAKELASLTLTGRASDPRVPVVVSIAGGGDGQFLVDGKDAGSGKSVTLALDPGSHEVRIKKAGKAEWKSLISVEETSPQQLTAKLVDERLQLWPISVGAGVLTVASAVVAVGAALAAEDQFRGTINLPFYDTTPQTTYVGVSPTDTQTLFTKQQGVETSALVANVMYVTSGVFAAATIGLVATDLILNASAE